MLKKSVLPSAKIFNKDGEKKKVIVDGKRNLNRQQGLQTWRRYISHPRKTLTGVCFWYGNKVALREERKCIEMNFEF